MAHADPGGHAWREVRTDRILLVTDMDGDDARERAREFEALASALADLYTLVVPRRPGPVRPIRIIDMAGCSDMRARYGENVGGFMTGSGDFGSERLVVTCEWGELVGEANRSLRTEVLVHELTHDLNARYLFNLPPWLEEGLASYYETLQLKEGVAIVGQPPPMDVRYWKEVSALPSMSRLMAMKYEELSRRGEGDRAGYFAAWKLTHLLANGSQDHHRRFRRMLAAFAAGRDKEAAFRESFGDIADRLADEYRSYHLNRQLNIWRLGYRRAAVGGVRSERVLRPGEAQALFIELAGSERRAGPGTMKAALERAERADASWPRLLYWRALVQTRDQTREKKPRPQAEALLRQYLAREPNDAQAWMGLVDVQMARVVPDWYIGVESLPPSGLQAIEKDVIGLVRVGSTPSQLNTIGWYYALLHRPQTGLNFAMRALEIEPGDGDIWDTLALLYFHAGRPAEAVAAQRRAVALMARDSVSVQPKVRARLLRYEQAAAAAHAGHP